MKMLFRQRIFSWFDSYDVYDEEGHTLFTVRGQLSWGHCLKIYDPAGREVGTVKEKVLTWLPKFEMWDASGYLGCLRKEFTFFRPRYDLDFNGWQLSGDFMEWDYRVTDAHGGLRASISKVIFRWTDTYQIEVADPADALYALMLVLAVDAEKCSRS